MRRQSSQLTTKNLTSTITSTITYGRRNFDIVTYNDNEITNSATTKLLYPPISRITYEQLRIPNFKTRILRTFYQRNPRMPLTRYRCTNNHTFNFQTFKADQYDIYSNAISIQVKQITTLEPRSMHHIVCQSQAKN